MRESAGWMSDSSSRNADTSTETESSLGTGRSRRAVLRSTGAALASALTVGAGSVGTASAASPDPGFVLQVLVPMLFDSSADELADPERAGTVEGNWDGDGIMLHSGQRRHGCTLGFSCDTYTVDVPFFVNWSTDADPADVGQVELHIRTNSRAYSDDSRTGGAGYLLEQPNVTFASRDRLGPIKFEHKLKRVASNLFRPSYIEVELDFEESNIRDGSVSERYQFTTLNRGLIGLDALVGVTDDLYNAFVEVADTLTPVDLGRLQKLTRLWGYSAAAGATEELDSPASDLPRNAAFKGISAFTDPIADVSQQRTFPNVGETHPQLAGPTLISAGGCDGGVPAIDGSCPTDVTGDGLYMDVDGDGELSQTDVVTFFENQHREKVQSHPEYFDYTGDGSVGHADVVELFETISTRPL